MTTYRGFIEHTILHFPNTGVPSSTSPPLPLPLPPPSLNIESQPSYAPSTRANPELDYCSVLSFLHVQVFLWRQRYSFPSAWNHRGDPLEQIVALAPLASGGVRRASNGSPRLTTPHTADHRTSTAPPQITGALSTPQITGAPTTARTTETFSGQAIEKVVCILLEKPVLAFCSWTLTRASNTFCGWYRSWE
jgi:hypothetical protein